MPRGIFRGTIEDDNSEPYPAVIGFLVVHLFVPKVMEGCSNIIN